MTVTEDAAPPAAAPQPPVLDPRRRNVVFVTIGLATNNRPACGGGSNAERLLVEDLSTGLPHRSRETVTAAAA